MGGFSTRAVHVGQEPEAEFGSVIPPIYMSSTYVQDSPGATRGYDYTRAGNPNYTALERQLAALENGEYATVFSSGLASLTALLATLEVGDRVVAIEGLYGGSYRLLIRVFARFGIEVALVPVGDLNALEASLASGAKMLLLESPTNPLLGVTDIEQATQLARRYRVTSVVDNTFATPYFQKPLLLGADVVLHSTTKYLGGHSDVVGGAVITNDPSLKSRMDFLRMSMGLNPSPFSCWLTGRGVKTLALRMEKHTDNAARLAAYLERHPLVSKVYYPGLATHDGHDVAARQMSGYGGMVSAEFSLPMEQVEKLISSLELFALAESLGGVESLVCVPASMTHASIPKETREKMGLGDGLVRFSPGIEDADDLIADLDRALRSIRGSIPIALD